MDRKGRMQSARKIYKSHRRALRAWLQLWNFPPFPPTAQGIAVLLRIRDNPAGSRLFMIHFLCREFRGLLFKKMITVTWFLVAKLKITIIWQGIYQKGQETSDYRIWNRAAREVRLEFARLQNRKTRTRLEFRARLPSSTFFREAPTRLEFAQSQKCPARTALI